MKKKLILFIIGLYILISCSSPLFVSCNWVYCVCMLYSKNCAFCTHSYINPCKEKKNRWQILRNCYWMYVSQNYHETLCDFVKICLLNVTVRVQCKQLYCNVYITVSSINPSWSTFSGFGRHIVPFAIYSMYRFQESILLVWQNWFLFIVLRRTQVQMYPVHVKYNEVLYTHWHNYGITYATMKI